MCLFCALEGDSNVLHKELWVLEPVSRANICIFLSFEATDLPYLNERPKITQDVRKLSTTIYIFIEATISAMHGKKL